MGRQFIFVVETNKKCQSDWMYIKDTIEHFYAFDRTQVKLSVVYMDGRGNYEKKEKDVQNLISQYKAASKKNQSRVIYCFDCNGVQREHNKKLNNGLPILHKVPPKRDYGRYFCIMAEKGGTSHGGLTEKLSLFFHAKKQEVNAYGR